jgi:hypothetical protein
VRFEDGKNQQSRAYMVFVSEEVQTTITAEISKWRVLYSGNPTAARRCYAVGYSQLKEIAAGRRVAAPTLQPKIYDSQLSLTLFLKYTKSRQDAVSRRRPTPISNGSRQRSEEFIDRPQFTRATDRIVVRTRSQRHIHPSALNPHLLNTCSQQPH